jgi:hypothetical protein
MRAMMTRTPEQEEIDAQYNQMCIAVDRLCDEIQKFRALYEPTDVSLLQFAESLHDMLMEVDAELEENR